MQIPFTRAHQKIIRQRIESFYLYFSQFLFIADKLESVFNIALNNQESTGNSIIVSFNSFPLKTKYTPSYKCPYYKFGPMDLTEIRSNMFRADEVYYDLRERNDKVLGTQSA